MTVASIKSDLQRGHSAVGELVSTIGADQWTAATPCSEWSVRDLVNHLVGVNLRFTGLLADGAMAPIPEDCLGDDPVAAYRTSSAALQEAADGAGVLERNYPGPFGEAAGAELLQLRLADLLTHGWDLSQAIGTPARLPEDLTERALAFFQGTLTPETRPGRFAGATPIDDAAPAIERLAAFAGRQVRPGS